MAIGSRKGEGCGSFIIGCLLGPFGIVFAIMSRGNRVNCPFCRELINESATVCAHCQRDIPQATTAPRGKPISIERLLIGVIILLAILILAKQFGE